MRDHDDAHAVAAQAVDQAHDLHPGAPVLAEGRLVEDEHARRRGQGGGHGQPPFLAAGERVRVLLGVLDEPEPRQQFTRAALRLRLIAPGAQRPEHHLLQYAAARELVLGVLEHVGDAGGQFGGFPGDRRVAVRARGQLGRSLHLSAHRFEQTGQRQRQRGFAGAVRADQRGDLSGGEIEVDMLGDGLPIAADGQVPRGQQHLSRADGRIV